VHGVRRGGRGGGEINGRIRRAGAEKGADEASASKREHGGSMTAMEGCCEGPDGGARWRDDGRGRRRSADMAAKMRAADHSGDLVWNTVGVPGRHL